MNVENNVMTVLLICWVKTLVLLPSFFSASFVDFELANICWFHCNNFSTEDKTNSNINSSISELCLGVLRL